MRSAVITVALLMFGVVVIKVLPPLSETRNIAGYLALHTLFETFSIVIAMLVFTVGWNAYRRGLPYNILLLACAFLGVGILDFTHMLSEAGMLDFLTPGSEVKEIHFTLYARSLAAIAFFVVSVTTWRPLTYAASRYILLAAVLILTGCLHWISLFHDDLMPATVIPGQGYTPFKIYYEYALVAFNMVTAFVLLMRMRRPQSFNAAALFGAVCTMALSEFFFTIYAAVNYDLLGHIYKAVSYFFLYRVIFVETIEHPYNQLYASQNKLQATLDAIPDLFFEIGLDGRFYDYHAHSTDFLAAAPEVFLGKTVFKVLPPDAAKICMSALQEASEQGRSIGRVIALQLPQCERWFELSVAAKPKQVGQDSRFIFLARDITARKHAEDELRIAAVAFESQESLMITDAGGVILRVNPAFTRDTGYPSAEAVGQTPRLLKSGRHDAAFYAEMWETLLRTGTWQGEIWDRRKNGEVYLKWLTITAVKDSNGTATHYVGTHIDITERKAAEEEIKSMAFYDPLTRLPNRRLLMVRLKQALASSARNGREGALLFIDLDNFKTLNDTRGHDVGDLLLQQVALRLESCIREGDTVARLGGDEFVVMLEDLSGHTLEASALTQAVGEKILTTLGQPYQLVSHEYHSTPSIGATLFNKNQQTIAELLKKADVAMYQAKKAGRNTLRFFDPQMQVAINARAALESELRRALEIGQFHLYYQIQVDSSRRTLGAEALIRWTHPERGLLSPDQFISLAEETGLILPIGLWVLETACAQIKTWQQAALTRDLVLAINVSPRQFHQADFAAQVQAAVQRQAINPQRLKLELTESLLQVKIEDTIATMNALKEIGVQLSLDDFGSGYSSLRNLQRMPLDQIKIDSSFIHDIATDNSDNAVVRTIIAMAQSLNMDVIAEGVEMNEQRQLLLNKGCTHYQGFLFGKPVPIEQFNALLKQG